MIFDVHTVFTFVLVNRSYRLHWTPNEIEMREVLCSAVCEFSVDVLILSITFDTEGRFIALWNFLFF